MNSARRQEEPEHPEWSEEYHAARSNIKNRTRLTKMSQLGLILLGFVSGLELADEIKPEPPKNVQVANIEDDEGIDDLHDQLALLGVTISFAGLPTNILLSRRGVNRVVQRFAAHHESPAGIDKIVDELWREVIDIEGGELQDEPTAMLDLDATGEKGAGPFLGILGGLGSSLGGALTPAMVSNIFDDAIQQPLRQAHFGFAAVTVAGLVGGGFLSYNSIALTEEAALSQLQNIESGLGFGN